MVPFKMYLIAMILNNVLEQYESIFKSVDMNTISLISSYPWLTWWENEQLIVDPPGQVSLLIKQTAAHMQKQV